MDMTWYDELEARIPKGSVRTRFAPSPTGYMHVGNLRTALYTWLIARKAHGTFIFRLEDTDQTRQVEGATELIYRTMNECGLTHDEGPDVGGPVGPYIQTQRRGLYGKYAQLLVEKGHAYYCFCEKAAAYLLKRPLPKLPQATPMSSARRSPTKAARPSPMLSLVTSPWRTTRWMTKC